MSRYGARFVAEAREHISALNTLLLTLERDLAADGAVEGMFRSVHTVKGMAASMGYDAVAELAHALEDLLSCLRGGVGDGAVELLFDAVDALEKTIEQAATGREDGVDVAPVVARLRAAAAEQCAVPSADAPGEREGADRTPDGAPGDAPEGALRIRVVIAPDAPLPGIRAKLALRRAREIGEVRRVQPPEAEFLESGFRGEVEFLLAADLAAAEVEAALRAVGDVASVAVEAVATSPEPKPAASVSPSAPAPQLRIDPRRLDVLFDQVGELVILRDRLRAITGVDEPIDLCETVGLMSRLVGDLRDEVLRMRTTPVGQAFDRLPRLVRDAARSLGKEVEFTLEGEGTEFDRSVLDALGDPLLHLLRNAVDHGLEPPDARLLAGKPAAGRLRVTATRERSRAVIRVEDDGRGICRRKVTERAVAAGLIAPSAAATLPDEEVFDLLTQPGFSTAERVTDVSGRGVGLDVVATRLRALGGTLEIASTERQGSRFTLRLPLTLAIVRALRIRLDAETYAIPVAHIAETLEVDPAEVRDTAGRRLVSLREDPLPLVSLRALLQRPTSTPSSTGPLCVVVLEVGDARVGLVVDDFDGQQEIVVREFDAPIGTLPVFSGATILPDGRPALILDVGNILSLAGRGSTLAAPAREPQLSVP